MALKLRRRLEVFTNGMLAHRRSGCEPNSVSGGAASFKRVLGGAPLRADRFFRIEKIPFTVSAAFNDKSIIADRLITDHLRRSSGRPKHHKRRIHRIDTRPQGGPKGQSFSLQRDCVIK